MTSVSQNRIGDLLTSPHAKVSELSVGNIVKVDPDYLIGEPDQRYEVKQDEEGLFIESTDEKFYLKPFIRGGGEYYLGIYLVDL